MDRTDLLRTTYRINAAATFACGAVLLAAGHLLASPFAVPEAALRVIGAAFVLLALWIWTLARRPQLLWSEAALLRSLSSRNQLGAQGVQQYDSKLRFVWKNQPLASR